MARICIPFKTSFLDYPTNEHCISIFFTGCWGDCVGCQNKELQNPDYNVNTKEMTAENILDVLCYEYKRHRTRKVCLLGGDPLFTTNIKTTKKLLELNSFFDICVYTGRSLDFIQENEIKGFTFIKTGKYLQDLYQLSEKNDKYFQLSSTNQKIYDKELNLLSKDGRIYF